MAKFQVTKREINSRAGFILLALGAYYLIEPVKSVIDNLNLPDYVVGVALIAIALYFFEF